MFVEKEVRPQGEQEVKKLKMSEAIRLGAVTVPESLGWHGCAIGTALKAVGKFNPYAFPHDHMETAKKVFNIPSRVLLRVNDLHYSGQARRLEIADELEAQGY